MLSILQYFHKSPSRTVTSSSGAITCSRDQRIFKKTVPRDHEIESRLVDVQSWFQPWSVTTFDHPLHLTVTASMSQTSPSCDRRVFRQSRGVTVGSGLRLCVKDTELQVCVLLVTQGDPSRVRCSSSQEFHHVLSSEISGPTTRSFSALHPRFKKRWSYRTTSFFTQFRQQYQTSKYL